MTTRSNQGRSIKTAERTFEIIETVRDLDGARLSELAEHIDLATSTLHDYLTTLVDMKYLTREGDHYHVGLKFLDHGIYAKNRLKLTKAANPVLDRLAEETGEVVWLVIEEHGEAVCIDQRQGRHGVKLYGRVGTRTPMHNHSAGKALLAHLPESRVRDIVSNHGFTQATEKTITDLETLLEELEQVREQGYAVNNEETVKGLRSISSPIVPDEVVGAIGVSGPKDRLKMERLQDQLAETVIGYSSEIELRFNSDIQRE